MSSTASSKRIDKSDNAVMSSGHDTTTEKSKVDFIYGAVPSRSKHDILLVLQSCDYNVETAISIFSQGQAEEVLKQWSYKGKRDGNRKKKNKRRQGIGKETKNDPEEKKDTTSKSELFNSSLKKPLHLSATGLSLNLKHDEPLVNGNSSQNNSTTSDPDKTTTKSIKGSNLDTHKNKQQTSKVEKLSPTSHSDALKKTTKDLARSTYSLARYQVVLEEECDQSFKRITKTFENIRKSIHEREQQLTTELKNFKEQGVNLLQQRLEDAAALRLKAERVQSMPDEQVVLLRADIKNFVAERKIDEELAQTKRFVCDEEKILKELQIFGQVVPMKGTYSPVVLNHHIPSTTSKPVNKLNASHPNDASKSNKKSSDIPKETNRTNDMPRPKSTTINTSNRPPTDKPPTPLTKLSSPAPQTSNILPQTSTITSMKDPPDQNLSSLLDRQQSSKIAKGSDESLSVGKVPLKNTKKENSKPLDSGDMKAKETKTTKQDISKPTSVTKTKNQIKQKTDEISPSLKNKGKNLQSPKKSIHGVDQKKNEVPATPNSALSVEASSKLSGPPPNISKLISMAMAKSSAIVSGEDPSKYQEANITSTSAQQKRGSRKNLKDPHRSQGNKSNSNHSMQRKQPNHDSSRQTQSHHKEKDKKPKTIPPNTEEHLEGQSEKGPSGKRRRQRKREGKNQKIIENDAKAVDKQPKKNDISTNDDHVHQQQDATRKKIDVSPQTGQSSTAELPEKCPQEMPEITNKTDPQDSCHPKSNIDESTVADYNGIVDSNSIRELQAPNDKVSSKQPETIQKNSEKLNGNVEIPPVLDGHVNKMSLTNGDFSLPNGEQMTAVTNEVLTILDDDNEQTKEIEGLSHDENSMTTTKNTETKDEKDKVELSLEQSNKNHKDNEKISIQSESIDDLSNETLSIEKMPVVKDSKADGEHRSTQSSNGEGKKEEQIMVEDVERNDLSSEINMVPNTIKKIEVTDKALDSINESNIDNKDESVKATSSEDTSTALPQRAQGRRRNRHAEKEKKTPDENGTSNGLSHGSDDSGKKEDSLVINKENEIVCGKLGEVVAPSLINGLEANQLEMDGQKVVLVSNGTGDECLVER